MSHDHAGVKVSYTSSSGVTIVHHFPNGPSTAGLAPDTSERTPLVEDDSKTLGLCDPDICESECDGLDHEFHPHFKTRLTWPMAIFFIVGEVLGAGIVAVADGLANTGYAGIAVMVVGCLGNLFVALIQAESLLLVGKLNPAYRRHLRDPYTTMTEVAMGRRARRVAGVLLHMLAISIITVYLLISADLLVMFVGQFTKVLSGDNSFRLWLVIFAAFLIPLTWFGTPHEFWGVALIAILTTLVAAVSFLVKLWVDAPKDLGSVKHRTVTVESFFFGVGTLFFAFSGAPFFPTVQSDMKKKSDFSKSAGLAYCVIFATYLPVALSGLLTLGAGVNANMVFNIIHAGALEPVVEELRWHKIFAYVALLCLGAHFVFAYVLIFNPMAQELEEMFKVPRVFCWQRCLIRTTLVLFTLFLGEVIPSFSIFLSLIGGTMLCILTYVFPFFIYLKLNRSAPFWKKGVLASLLLMCVICVVGVVYANVKAIIRLYS